MGDQYILKSQSEGVSILTLNRPDKHNAMHQAMIVELLQALKSFAEDATKVLLIKANGKNFCAGGDIAWMKTMATAGANENQQDAKLLADLLYQLYTFPKPTIVLAQGACLGGGLGIISAADIAVAANNASFALPEVKIGLVPSVISPYVIAAIGSRYAHYYFLTGEYFTTQEAHRIGLIQRVAEEDALLSVGMLIAKTVMENGPQALSTAKKLIASMINQTITTELIKKSADNLAMIRTTKEAQEGLQAFLEKRPPSWRS